MRQGSDGLFMTILLGEPSRRPIEENSQHLLRHLIVTNPTYSFKKKRPNNISPPGMSWIDTGILHWRVLVGMCRLTP